jgi:type II secretory pathway component GspD/PulD (secretin)
MLLESIDKAKGQIVVETKILRINSTAGERVGVNWSASLGEAGVPIEAVRSLNSVFGLQSDFSTAGSSLGSALSSEELSTNNLVLSPFQLNGVLRALAEGGFATQISNPTLITEDNEQATISIIDRVPIITTTVTQSNGINNTSEEVRYTIDEGDPTITSDPRNHREIGISMVVTPTLLPDGTVRMALRPRSAQIVEEIRGESGNIFPRVTESMVEALARVPDGHSLVVGGFYGESTSKDKTKVPLLGDLPVINFFFKSRETAKEQTSLVFVVTPTSYDPSSGHSNSATGDRIRAGVALPEDHSWVDETNPGPAHEPNLQRTIRGMQPQQAPYYPTAAELNAGHDAKGGVAPAPAPRRFGAAGRR